MDERKKSVLHAIIKDYISTGEPVGSRVVAKKYDLGVSPATIRNEMSDLEELGYIEQPHTSAGRMPSEKGYRYYVDNLMEKEQLTEEEEDNIRKSMLAQLKEMDSFMQQCCQMVSKLTNYAALILLPDHENGKLEKLQLLPIDNNQLLIIIVSNTGVLRHRLLKIPENFPKEQVSKLEASLSSKLYGVDMDSLDKRLLAEAFQEVYRQQENFVQILHFMDQVLTHKDGDKFFFSGALNILTQPEFRNLAKIQNVVSLFEGNQVKNLLPNNEGKGTKIVIGSEIPQEEMKDCSMVVSSYDVDKDKSGTIGVLGPIRMSYPKTISLVEFIASEISEMMSGKGE